VNQSIVSLQAGSIITIFVPLSVFLIVYCFHIIQTAVGRLIVISHAAQSTKTDEFVSSKVIGVVVIIEIAVFITDVSALSPCLTQFI
jgi:hypothetical protein